MSVGALNMHSMQVKCEVEADPADSVKFHWTYNNTRNVSPVSNLICDVEALQKKSGKSRWNVMPDDEGARMLVGISARKFVWTS